jgi:signal-transduction protein with cAMP-binding, CBS, and nucleotidyltransferase domain
MSDAQASVARSIRSIVSCDASTSIRDVAKAMTDSEHSCALVRSETRLGLVTDRSP